MHVSGHLGWKALSFSVALLLAVGSPGWAQEGTAKPAASEAAPPPAQPDDQPVLLFPILKDGKWGYMDEKGKVAIEPQFEAALDFHEGLACVIVNGWRGFIDRTGQIVIKADLAWAGSFRDGFAPVYNEKSAFAGRPQFYRPTSGSFCCIDRAGKVQRFGCSTAGFREGLTVSGKGTFVGTDGKQIKTDADELCLFSDGLAPARKGGLWGYLDHDMNWAVQPQFYEVDECSEGLAGVAKTDSPPPTSGSISDWQKKVKLKWGFCDKTGKLVIDCQFEDAMPFSEGLAPVRLGGKWGYVDKTGTIQPQYDPQYDRAWPFSEGMARVMVGDKQGFINKQGKLVVQPQYQPAWEFNKGLARVTLDGKEGYIDPKGNYVWEPTK